MADDKSDRGKLDFITERYTSRSEWLRARRTGIGASDASAVLNVSPFGSPLSVYLSKISEPKPEDSVPNYIEWGNRLEPLVASAFAEKVEGRSVVPRTSTFELCRSPKIPWLIASLDRLQHVRGRASGVLEIKTSVFGDEWGDEPPIEYQVQVQHQLAVTGLEWGSIAVLIGGFRFMWADVERNDRFIQNMLQIEEAFWQRVQERRPPPVGAFDRDVLMRLFPRDTGEVIPLPPEADDLIDRRAEFKAQIAGVQEQLDLVENRMKALLGDALRGVLPGGRAISWKAEFIKQHVVKDSTRRVLRVHEPKKKG